MKQTPTPLAALISWLGGYLVRFHPSTDRALIMFAKNNKISVEEAILLIVDEYFDQDDIELANERHEERNK